MKRFIILLLALFLFTAGCTGKPAGPDGSLDSGSSALPAISSEEPTESLPDPSEETAASEPESNAEPAAAPTPAAETTSSAPESDPSVLDEFTAEQLAVMKDMNRRIATYYIRTREARNAEYPDLYNYPPITYREDLMEAATRYAKECFYTAKQKGMTEMIKPGKSAAAIFAEAGVGATVIADSVWRQPDELVTDPYGPEKFASLWQEAAWDGYIILTADSDSATGFVIASYSPDASAPLYVMIAVR